jgi:predicted transposase YbfD/YdcC
MEIAAMGPRTKSLVCHLTALPDPRNVKGQRHILLDIIVIAVLATLCGVDDWEGIEEFGKDQEVWLRTFLTLPNAIPSHDTFNRVFQMLDPSAFQEVFLTWVRGIRDRIPGDVVALDGKTLRSSLADGKPALHVVSAWSTANRLVLGQRAVDEKSNEITAIPELLKVLDLAGCIVTIDAMGCQKAIAKGIVKRKADYVLAVKGNQERLHNCIQEGFAKLDANPSAVPHFQSETMESAHGRKELRRVATLDALAYVPEDILFSWAKLETITRIQTEVLRGGKETTEERFFISTLPACKVEVIGQSVRSHWGIENQLHWVLDVAFREDGNRTRTGNAPECSAVLRHIVLNLLRQDANPEKKSVKVRRLRAALVPEYRMVALLGFPPSCQPAARERKKGYVALKGKVFSVHPSLLG